MATVAALYRYPVKSFTPESCESLTIVNGRIAGDRVLGFRFANTPEPDEAWGRRQGMLVLVGRPASRACASATTRQISAAEHQLGR